MFCKVPCRRRGSNQSCYYPSNKYTLFSPVSAIPASTSIFRFLLPSSIVAILCGEVHESFSSSSHSYLLCQAILLKSNFVSIKFLILSIVCPDPSKISILSVRVTLHYLISTLTIRRPKWPLFVLFSELTTRCFSSSKSLRLLSLSDCNSSS